MKNDIFGDIFEYADRHAVISSTGFLTYNDLAFVSNEIRTFLKSKSLIFHMCSNSFASIAGYIAFINNKQVQVLLSEEVSDDILNKLMELYHPRYLYTSIENQKKYCNYEFVTNIYGYVLLKTQYESNYVINDKLALLLTTSGSTGSPKYVRQSYINIRDNAEAIIKYLAINQHDRPIIYLPMCYTYGLSVINSHLIAGSTLLITDKKITQKEFWEFFKEQKVTSFSGTPYIYEILNKLGFTNLSLPNLKVMTQAGGKLPEILHKKFAEYAVGNNIRFYAMYGQTEATARMSYLPYEKSIEKCGSVGIAIPGGRLALVDDFGGEINKPYTPGQIVYYGSNVTLGYAENFKDLAKDDERGGMLLTGDIGIKDEEEYYYIVGRKKRIIKLYDKRINLDEVENLVKNKFSSFESCCSGIDNKLLIFVDTHEEQLKCSIKKYITDKMNITPLTVEVRYINRIPKTDAGKVIYNMLDV